MPIYDFSSLGGSKRISGIHYAEDSDIPKRSRELVWKAAVERSVNASQLALQVCNIVACFLFSSVAYHVLVQQQIV